MRPGFLLDPDVAYLNHGSYGACPIEVFEVYQDWQRRLEQDPQDFFTRRFDQAMRSAREALAAFVGARADDLVFVPNATSGLNAVLRSLRLEPGDEVLTTGHEYGAILGSLEFVGANVVVSDPDGLVSRIGTRTRVVLLSHVTSPTAVALPVEEICRAARESGALAIVDGAHAPGQLPLDIGSIGADVYAGNCHKWLCAPKGAGFLWASPQHQDWIAPLVISWGYREGADFGERHGWQGTRDSSAYLSVPRAIDVHATFALERMRRLADEAEDRLAALGCRRLPGTPAPYMRAVELPPGDPDELSLRLFREHLVEVPVYEWGGRRILRVSIGPYNDEGDLERLELALRALL